MCCGVLKTVTFELLMKMPKMLHNWPALANHDFAPLVRLTIGLFKLFISVS